MVEPVFENAAEIIDKFIVDMTRYFQLSSVWVVLTFTGAEF